MARLELGKRRLFLTQKGDEMHDRIIEIALRREAALLDGIEGEEREVLFGLLRRMTENLSKVEAVDRELTGQELRSHWPSTDRTASAPPCRPSPG